MFFSSKRDIWMTALLWGFGIMLLIVPIFFPEVGIWIFPDFLDKQWIRVMTVSPFGLLMLWVWFRTGYIIEEKMILIQFGPFRFRHLIKDIQSFRMTKNVFSAPSLFADRIELTFKNFKTVTISPRNQKQFIHLLKEKNPHIEEST